MPSAERDHVAFEVAGEPRTKGSFRAIVHPKKKTKKGGPLAVLVPQNTDAQGDWLSAVRTAATMAMDAWELPMTSAVKVLLDFRFRRPKSHYRTGRNERLLREDAPRWPVSKGLGDCDKLARAVLDAMNHVVFDDDAQVQSLVVEKHYVDRFEARSGLSVEVFSLAESSDMRASQASG